MRGLELDEQVNMIRGASNDFAPRAKPLTVPPRYSCNCDRHADIDYRFAMLRGEDQMIMEAEES